METNPGVHGSQAASYRLNYGNWFFEISRVGISFFGGEGSSTLSIAAVKLLKGAIKPTTHRSHHSEMNFE